MSLFLRTISISRNPIALLAHAVSRVCIFSIFTEIDLVAILDRKRSERFNICSTLLLLVCVFGTILTYIRLLAL